MSDSPNHLRSIWYHSEPLDVRYSENLLRPISWFGLFLQQNDSRSLLLKSHTKDRNEYQTKLKLCKYCAQLACLRSLLLCPSRLGARHQASTNIMCVSCLRNSRSRALQLVAATENRGMRMPVQQPPPQNFRFNLFRSDLIGILSG